MRSIMRIFFMTALMCVSAYRACGQLPLGSSSAVVLDMKLVQEKELLIANLGESIEIWNYHAKTFVKRWPASKIVAIDYRDGRLVGASATGSVVVWDTESGNTLLEKRVSDAPLVTVAWLDDDHFVVSGENHAVLKISAAAGAVVSQVAHSTTVTALASVNDQAVIAGDDRGMLTAYDAGSMTVRNSVKGHGNWVRQIVSSDSLPAFYSVSDDGTICHWDERELRSSARKRMGNWVLAADVVDYSNAEKRVTAIGKRSGELVVDVAIARYSVRLDAMITRVEIIRSVFPDILVAVATYGSGIQLWDGKEMKLHKKGFKPGDHYSNVEVVK